MFCDGSYKGGDFMFKEFKVEKLEIVYFCGCKNSVNGMICDGSY